MCTDLNKTKITSVSYVEYVEQYSSIFTCNPLDSYKCYLELVEKHNQDLEINNIK